MLNEYQHRFENNMWDRGMLGGTIPIATFCGSDIELCLHSSWMEKTESERRTIPSCLSIHPNWAFCRLGVRVAADNQDSRVQRVPLLPSIFLDERQSGRRYFPCQKWLQLSEMLPVCLGFNLFAIIRYKLYTKLAIIPRSLNGKWYFPSRLNIPKRKETVFAEGQFRRQFNKRKKSVMNRFVSWFQK
jgi:hypothetical protein